MMQRREFLGCRFVGRDLALYTCWVFDSFSTSFRHVRFVVGVAPTRYGHGLSIGTFAVGFCERKKLQVIFFYFGETGSSVL